MAIGDDTNGWTFYAEDGVVNGRQVTQVQKFATLSDLESSLTDYQSGRGGPMMILNAFDSQQGEHTSPLQDILMNTWAMEHLKDPFSGPSNNCGDLVLGALRAGGLNPSKNALGPTRPNAMSIGPDNDPNRFNPILELGRN
ncbi:MAG: hypothetical protein V4566_08305 [Pseudomonadota bacterium]